ncbi:MAG: hypothetical protein JSW11_11285 [Candidatus Heimdallarchaeota archaeon]|nr:MAG: hypothetical protein JSW11_11285 [Candidatus Heimdallarchaeota archaeon]
MELAKCIKLTLNNYQILIERVFSSKRITNMMRLNTKLLSLLLIILFLTVFYPLKATIAVPRTDQRLVPFIGMVVDYKLKVRIDGIIPVTANWTVTWEQYNKTTPSVFISNLTVQSLYITLFTLGVRDRESGIIIENITSRQVLYVNLTDTTFLQMLYSTYFSPDKPNYSPFYINTTEITIGDHINVYSFNMTVITANRTRVADFGWRDVWIIQVIAKEINVEHFIRLIYDNTTGVLVGGRIETRWFQGNETLRDYKVEIICQYTNALERHLIIIETNRILVILVSCIPIIPSLAKILRMKEIEGGL